MKVVLVASLLCLTFAAVAFAAANNAAAAAAAATTTMAGRSMRGASSRRLQTPVITEVPIVGGVTSTSAKIGFRTSDAALVQVEFADNKNFRRSTMWGSLFVTTASNDFTGAIELTGLDPATKYWYQLHVDSVAQSSAIVQKFETFPSGTGTVKFSIFADAAKYYNDKAAAAYQAGSPNQDGSLFALQIGDFDHSDPMNITALRTMHRALRDPDLAGGEDFARFVATKMAFAHVYDDHDFCGNDSDGTCPHKADVLQAYNEYYPGYSRPYPLDGIYHKFTAGPAEIFMLDTRYNRSPNDQEDNANKTMLGETQKQWLKDSLTASTATWKIIVSTVSANIHARTCARGYDHWISFQTEAAELKDFIAADTDLKDSTILVTGDLHSGGAIDGGCNNRFGIPELGVAHTNLVKGNQNSYGIWSEGSRDGSSVQGYASITASSSSLVLETKDEDGNLILSLTLQAGSPVSYNTTGCVEYEEQQCGLRKCSENYMEFGTVSEGDCADVDQGQNYTAPLDNADGPTPIDNVVEWYDCPVSDLIIMRSNDIPQHFFQLNNPNLPCVQNFHAEMPRTPQAVAEADKKETDNIQGFAINGIVAFSALEAGDLNAVEPLENATLLDAQHWWGHPSARNVWHYHSPLLGQNDSISIPSNMLLGVAMDGFPIRGPVTNPDVVLDKCNFDPVDQSYHIRTKDQVDETADYCNGDDVGVNWKYILGCFSGNLTRSVLKDSSTTSIPSDCVLVSDVTTLF